MKINAKIVNLRNSIIDFLLDKLERTKALPNNGYIDLSSLSDENRKKAFREFSEGNEGLYQLLKIAYENGLESTFCCGGHNKNDLGYITFNVNTENIEVLRQIGKFLSYESIATNFDRHYKYGDRVTFRGITGSDKNWFYKLTEAIKNPPRNDIVPDICYHEEFFEITQDISNIDKKSPLTIKDKLINRLRKMRFDEQPKMQNMEIQKSFSDRLKEEYPISNHKGQINKAETKEFEENERDRDAK